MADTNDMFNVLSSAEQIRANYEQFKDKFVDKDKDLISQETFLNLLVAEMSNQDPLEPTSNTEFISQLAQFSSMQYMQNSSKYSMATYATSLVGKTATGSKMDGPDLVLKTGVVEKVVAQNNSYIVTIDGEEFDISKVTTVVDSNSVTGASGTLADQIIKASGMVGKYAWIDTGEKIEKEDPEGDKDTEDKDDTEVETKKVEGVIESVLVKDGKVNVVVNGKPYDIEKIEEVTLAYFDESDPEAPDDTEKVEGSGGETAEGKSIEDKSDANETSEDVPDLTGLSEEDQKLYEQLQDLINSMK